ncbi:L-aspartate oxidase [Limimonas halophila]|uniref:L-aspartate oxidase n=1 Tax=Limimonas halophila TaxID=1082479 RepID=A0A1G7PVF7_9PROT|nr:L-aspartate oxidase [Limimonas halophila]SDF90238.1 L-aspartate oxidase [Limimonas halophila]
MADAPVIVVGAGAAGLATALHLAPLPVTVLTPASLGREAATGWAQGGLAAAVGPDDTPARHAADTEAVGGGLVDPAVARAVADAAPERIAWLDRLGTVFDRDDGGALALGLEAGHSRRRIVRAAGDGSGKAVLDALIAAVRAEPAITVREGAWAVRVLTGEAGVQGVALADGTVLPARAAVLACGGVGGLFAGTTTPLGACGQGLAMAARAGAGIRNAEFVQFHPTAMDLDADPLPLATEALRGEGVPLVDATGARVMARHPAGELAPRDAVARTVHECRAVGHAVYLDTPTQLGGDMPARFPRVTAACRAAGLDPVTRAIPVRPAAHFHIGGVAADLHGRTGVDGLYACGEAACTGLHGANRLASNGVIEGLATAPWVAEAIAASPPADARAPRAQVQPQAAADRAPLALRRLMERNCGPVRDGAGLAAAVDWLADRADRDDTALAALVIAEAARRRPETRGAHARRDAPDAEAIAGDSQLTLADVVPRSVGLEGCAA